MSNPAVPHTTSNRQGPLVGLKVLELGQLIAGPFAARTLAEFGAEVIKVEPPEGDPLRSWRVIENGTSLWWLVQSRNKRSITINLRTQEGQEIVRRLAASSDILIENFRPGTLERWGLDPEDLLRINPGLIIVRISGYGQSGPYSGKPGFGSIAESMGGIRYLTGYPDRPPVRVGISLGDSLAALHAVNATLMALHHRTVSGRGQVVDVALYESVFNLMESLVPEYYEKGIVRERTGNILPGVAPSNSYQCGDGRHVVIGGNGDSIFRRFMQAIGREDLAADPGLQDNAGRASRQAWLDEQIETWTRQHPIDHVLQTMDEAEVPAGLIYSVADMFDDPHFRERGMIQMHEVPGIGKVALPGIVPRLSETPGATEWTGPSLGQHTDEVLASLGYSEGEIRQLRERAVI